MSSENQTNDATKLVVSVSFGEAKAEFSGSPEIVLQAINNFLTKQIPQLDLAGKLSVNFSTADLVEKFKDFVKITPEGPRVWSQERKFSDKELIALQLVAQRIAAETRDSYQASMSLGSLQEITSLNPKSLSSRLSEMTKAGLVVRDALGDKPQFKITTAGIEWLSGVLSKGSSSR